MTVMEVVVSTGGQLCEREGWVLLSSAQLHWLQGDLVTRVHQSTLATTHIKGCVYCVVIIGHLHYRFATKINVCHDMRNSCGENILKANVVLCCKSVEQWKCCVKFVVGD